MSLISQDTNLLHELSCQRVDTSTLFNRSNRELIDRALDKGINFRDLYYFARDTTIPKLQDKIQLLMEKANNKPIEQVIYKTNWLVTGALILLIETIDIILILKLK